jgi:hypothetical protein
MEEQKTPSILGMIKSFTKDLTKYIKEGAPNVSTEDYAIRLDTCNSCEHLKKSSMRCGKCGCLLEHKAKWKTADCPDNRWPKQNNDKG